MNYREQLSIQTRLLVQLLHLCVSSSTLVWPVIVSWNVVATGYIFCPTGLLHKSEGRNWRQLHCAGSCRHYPGRSADLAAGHDHFPSLRHPTHKGIVRMITFLGPCRVDLLGGLLISAGCRSEDLFTHVSQCWFVLVLCVFDCFVKCCFYQERGFFWGGGGEHCWESVCNEMVMDGVGKPLFLSDSVSFFHSRLGWSWYSARWPWCIWNDTNVFYSVPKQYAIVIICDVS